ncbi:MAG TPA: SprT-like domain-containing protein [Bryobacteraceae bacterium]|nr:SprT-like domain-containing protein [Bryobacteraceae bacterium]
MPLESTIFFETPEQIWARVFRSIRPRTPVPAIEVRFCRFANVNSTVRLENGRMLVRISDLLSGAPAPIQEALAWILLSKLYRKTVPRLWSHRYRLFLNRRDVRRSIEQVRQERGRKYISGPQGEAYNLEEIFEELNFRYFHGLMARPELSWSRERSRTMLGHYDAAHHAIVLSRILDRREVPRLAVEYVMFHEMLHLRHPVEHKGVRRCVHTSDFRDAEKHFDQLAEAKAALKRL